MRPLTLGLLIIANLLAWVRPPNSTAKPPSNDRQSRQRQPPTKSQRRSLERLIDLALTKGREATIKSPMVEDLGFKSVLPARMLRYERQSGQLVETHSFYVVFEVSKKGLMKPAALIWFGLWTTNTESGEIDDGWQFRTTAAGGLTNAAHMQGDSQRLDQAPVLLDEAVRKRFESLKTFFLQDATALDLMT